MPFQIVRNDITKMKVDAIVNTASQTPGYGAGTDAAVYEAAGSQKLLARRREIGEIGCGQAVVTEGFDLPAGHIIHTVGTPWQEGNSGEEEIIRSCYRNVFRLALENGFESLAIPLLASGSYGFPKDTALKIALSEIESFMSDHDIELSLVVYDKESFSLSSALYGDIEEYINDNYVETQAVAENLNLYGSPGDRRPGGERRSFAAAVRDKLFGGDGESRRGARKGKHAARATEGVLEAPHASKESAPAARAMEESAEVAEGASREYVADDASREYVADGSFPKYMSDGASREYMAGAASQAYMAGAARSLEDVVKNLEKSFMELVFSFADERGLTDVEVQKRANLDRKAFSKLKCGTTKNPSKATALAFAVALELNLDDTKDLLSRAGYALSPCSKQDVIVQYFIERRAYDIYKINVALFEHGEQLLGSQAS
ncbi:MAG: macro domain-containing protein [Lachnospiraceae bacterium]|nr:macro domain-containing protein [Lachnospiraceae bacterium]